MKTAEEFLDSLTGLDTSRTAALVRLRLFQQDARRAALDEAETALKLIQNPFHDITQKASNQAVAWMRSEGSKRILALRDKHPVKI